MCSRTARLPKRCGQVLCLPIANHNSFSQNILDWVESNLGNHKRDSGSLIPWASLYGLIACRSWKNRNLFIFQGVSSSLGETVNISMCWAKQYNATHKWDPIRSLHDVSDYSLGEILGQFSN